MAHLETTIGVLTVGKAMNFALELDCSPFKPIEVDGWLCNVPQRDFVHYSLLQLDGADLEPPGTKVEAYAPISAGLLHRVAPTPCRRSVKLRGRYTGARLDGLSSYVGPFTLVIRFQGKSLP